MSRVIDLCEDSDDNGEAPTTASVPSLPLSRKRHRSKEDSSSDVHTRNEINPGDKTATGSAEFAVDLELADEVEISVSPHKKRRGVMNSERSAKNDAAGKPAQAGGWENNFKSLCEYRQSKGHSNFRCPDPEYAELSNWVISQRCEYRRMVEGEDSVMNPERVKALESIGFVWKTKRPSLEDRGVMKGERSVKNGAAGKCAKIMNAEDDWTKKFKELCRYRQSKGHYIFRGQDPEDEELSKWVASLRSEYRHSVKKYVILTPKRVKALKGIGFVWNQPPRPSWEDRLSELADYRKIHGHCNVPRSNSENTKLANWIKTQRINYRLYQEGKTTQMTLFRIQELETLGFAWDRYGAAWKERLSELADYRKIHGHCNIPRIFSENAKLGLWVGTQRINYRLHVKGKTTPMTLSRIQELERLGFDWKICISSRKGTPKKSNLDDGVTSSHESDVESPEQQYSLKKIAALEKSAAMKLTSLSNPTNPTGTTAPMGDSAEANT